MSVSNLDLFFTFIKGDYRASSDFIKSKKGLPVAELDFALIRYTGSLRDRVRRLHILHSKAIETFSIIKEEIGADNEITDEVYMKHIELVIYFEAFLNEIYSIMENVARINLFMFDDSYDISQNFHDQMKKIRNKSKPLHIDYDKMIIEDMGWYNEVNSIRSNTNHYLTGTPIFSRLADDTLIPKYLNFSVSNRDYQHEHGFRIEKDILDSMQSYFDNTIQTLENIAKIYIERIDKDKPCAIPFQEGNQLVFRKITLNEYIELAKDNSLTFI